MPWSSASTAAIWFETPLEVAVGPGLGAGREQAGPVGSQPLGDRVEQLDRAVEAVRVVQLGQVEQELGPLIGREVVAAERVDVGGRCQRHGLTFLGAAAM